MLTAARHIYAKAGFKLIRSEERISCGHRSSAKIGILEL